ncbi:S1 RNA-binding domain-containing protein [Pediococcus ethanolidurans]|nr:S1 RNA-binding domain-containing protein [Pediococcus ethanolidurans]
MGGVSLLKTGDIVQGTITGIQSYGIFVEDCASSFKGLVHISECSDEYIGDLSSFYKIGQDISCLIVDIDPINQHISLSIRALDQQKNIHDKPNPSVVHAYHKFYWTSNENDVGFGSIAANLSDWKTEARQTYNIRS